VGGPNSGCRDHKWRPARKKVVEECLSLDACHWRREGILKAGVFRSGTCRWTDSNGAETGAIGFVVYTVDSGGPWVRLSYTITPTGEQVNDWVPLTTTRPHLGGVRWWLACPLPGQDGPCGRRVGKLYLPPAGGHFGCRRCHRLTYNSSQESRKYDSLFCRLAQGTGLDFEMVKRTLSRRGDRRCWLTG
jgi:hypothetical protein